MISVIIPTYNRANTIERAIQSVLNQTYKELELIIIDDGSTDSTDEVVKNINDPRIIYIKQTNSGACAARNNGIKLARGEYIAFQDSDDTWVNTKLQDQMEIFSLMDVDVIFCKIQRHDYKSNSGDPFYPNIRPGIVPESLLLEKSIVSTQTILCKSNVLKSNLFDVDMPRFQDYDLVIRLSQNYKFYFIDKVLADVYLQEDSITLNIDKTILAHKKILYKYSTLWEKYPKIKAWHLNAIAMIEYKRGNINPNYFYKVYQINKSKMSYFKYLLSKYHVLKIVALLKGYK